MHCNHSHHQTPEEPGNISSVICSQSHSLKWSRIWNQFLKTAHEIKGLVQRKTGNQPVMETKTREGFWTDLGTRMQIPSRLGFPDLVVPMCRQEMVKRSVHYKMLLQALPHSLLLGHIPPALSTLLIPGCKVGSHSSPPMERKQAGPRSPAFHATKIFSQEQPPQRWSGQRRQISWVIIPLK